MGEFAIPAGYSGSFKASGGSNVWTGEENKEVFKGHTEISLNISPVTTMVKGFMDDGDSVEDAKTATVNLVKACGVNLEKEDLFGVSASKRLSQNDDVSSTLFAAFNAVNNLQKSLVAAVRADVENEGIEEGLEAIHNKTMEKLRIAVKSKGADMSIDEVIEESLEASKEFVGRSIESSRKKIVSEEIQLRVSKIVNADMQVEGEGEIPTLLKRISDIEDEARVGFSDAIIQEAIILDKQDMDEEEFEQYLDEMQNTRRVEFTAEKEAKEEAEGKVSYENSILTYKLEKEASETMKVDREAAAEEAAIAKAKAKAEAEAAAAAKAKAEADLADRLAEEAAAKAKAEAEAAAKAKAEAEAEAAEEAAAKAKAEAEAAEAEAAKAKAEAEAAEAEAASKTVESFEARINPIIESEKSIYQWYDDGDDLETLKSKSLLKFNSLKELDIRSQEEMQILMNKIETAAREDLDGQWDKINVLMAPYRAIRDSYYAQYFIDAADEKSTWIVSDYYLSKTEQWLTNDPQEYFDSYSEEGEAWQLEEGLYRYLKKSAKDEIKSLIQTKIDADLAVKSRLFIPVDALEVKELDVYGGKITLSVKDDNPHNRALSFIERVKRGDSTTDVSLDNNAGVYIGGDYGYSDTYIEIPAYAEETYEDGKLEYVIPFQAKQGIEGTIGVNVKATNTNVAACGVAYVSMKECGEYELTSFRISHNGSAWQAQNTQTMDGVNFWDRIDTLSNTFIWNLEAMEIAEIYSINERDGDTYESVLDFINKNPYFDSRYLSLGTFKKNTLGWTYFDSVRLWEIKPCEVGFNKEESLFLNRISTGILQEELSENLYKKLDYDNGQVKFYELEGEEYKLFTGQAYELVEESHPDTESQLNNLGNARLHFFVNGIAIQDGIQRYNFGLRGYTTGYADCDGIERSRVLTVSGYDLGINWRAESHWEGMNIIFKDSNGTEMCNETIGSVNPIANAFASAGLATNKQYLIEVTIDAESNTITLQHVLGGYHGGVGRYGVADENGAWNWDWSDCTDTDGDGFYDQVDVDPNDPGFWKDWDFDGLPDSVDPYPYDEGVAYTTVEDLETGEIVAYNADMTKWVSEDEEFIYVLYPAEGGKGKGEETPPTLHAYKVLSSYTESPDGVTKLTLNGNWRINNIEPGSDTIEMLNAYRSKYAGKGKKK